MGVPHSRVTFRHHTHRETEAVYGAGTWRMGGIAREGRRPDPIRGIEIAIQFSVGNQVGRGAGTDLGEKEPGHETLLSEDGIPFSTLLRCQPVTHGVDRSLPFGVVDGGRGGENRPGNLRGVRRHIVCNQTSAPRDTHEDDVPCANCLPNGLEIRDLTCNCVLRHVRQAC